MAGKTGTTILTELSKLKSGPVLELFEEIVRGCEPLPPGHMLGVGKKCGHITASCCGLGHIPMDQFEHGRKCPDYTTRKPRKKK
jgi:hypothetical protein